LPGFLGSIVVLAFFNLPHAIAYPADGLDIFARFPNLLLHNQAN